MAGIEPGRLWDKGPAEDNQRDRGPEDAHSQQVVVRVLLVELLHHHGNDYAAYIAPDQLEGDHTATNVVRTDLHDVDLAHDLEDANTSTIAKLREGPNGRGLGRVEENAADDQPDPGEVEGHFASKPIGEPGDVEEGDDLADVKKSTPCAHPSFIKCSHAGAAITKLLDKASVRDDRA